TGFMVARASLGVSEGGNFPSAIKATAQWFSKRECAYATSIFNAGTNVGAIVAPAIVHWIALTWGWQWAFIIAGIAGLLWLILWIPLYDRPEKSKRVNAAELELIESDREDQNETQKVSWLGLLRYRQTWSFIVAKFMTDP